MPEPARSSQINIPNRSFRRVTWIDSRERNRRLKSLFNPEQLPLATTAKVGELEPIGFSQPTQQFASTGATRYSVALPFSLRAYKDMNIPFTDVRQASAFFRSFCYGGRQGEAPSFLIMVWPKTAHIINTVRSVNVTYERWDADMNVTGYRVDMELVEVRRTFLSKTQVSDPNLDLMLPDVAVVFYTEGGTTGRPLNVSGATSKMKTGSGGG